MRRPRANHSRIVARHNYRHLKAFQHAYKGLGWRPKHHWAYHLWHMFKTFVFLLGLLVTERRHKIVKRWSKDKFNSSSFERGLMEELTLQHLADLAPPWLTRGLVDDVVPNATLMRELQAEYPRAKIIMSANSARVHQQLFTRGDVVLCRALGHLSVGEIIWFARIDEREVVCVSSWQRTPTANDTTWTRTYRKQTRHEIHPLPLMLAPLTYLPSNSAVTVLIPLEYRA